jgi:iron(III) transport system substrate-binding protein
MAAPASLLAAEAKRPGSNWEVIAVIRPAATAFLAALISSWLGSAALAQDAPALNGASPDEKVRISKLLDAARKEGAVSYYDTVIQPETNDLLAAAFRKAYALPASFAVNYTLLSTSNLVTRVEQELNANRITADVAAIASPAWVFERAGKGDITEYASPEYAHYGPAVANGFAKPNLFAPNGGYLFVPMWNADNLQFKGKSLKDVINAVPQGRLSIGDASNSTSYLATYIGQKQVLERSHFEQLAKMKPSFLVRSEQIAERLVSGQDLLAYSGQLTRAYQLNQRGAEIKFIIPEEGVVLMPQCMFIMRNAPHPNAAKLWTDFVLSEEGQTILAKGEAMVSSRAGFKSPLPDYAPPLEQLRLIKVDWEHLSTAEFQKARAEWLSIFNP